MANKFFAEYIGPQYEWSQSEGAGVSLRIGRRAWVLGSLDYRDRDSVWPRWLRFRLVLNGPLNPSMSNRRHFALYLFGARIFDTLYWDHSNG